MSYQVLARKWRPQSLEDMVGQEPIRRMLSNALKHHRIHHAYLFSGTRGVGKTTLSRILAKCLNCQTGLSPTPCGTCSVCLAVDAGQFLDLYEIDAASRTKVEDMRDLLENVAYPPVQGRYKIYLIDEVHMLSNHSFNALLKTLEEPPEHVKFILATTDPKRLPITILSRCLQFHLKRIPTEQISAHLQHVCTKENIAYEKPALEKLAKAADGSLRDAMSLLDQAIAYSDQQIKNQDIIEMLGSMGKDDLFSLLTALKAGHYSQLFSLVSQIAEHAPDFYLVFDELINLLHQIALTQMLPALKTTEENIQELAKTLTSEEVQLYYQIALLGKRDLDFAVSPQQGFEMTLLRMMAFKPNITAETSFQPQENPVQINSNHHMIETSLQAAASQEASELINPKSNDIIHSSPEESHSQENGPLTNIQTEWRDLLPKLELSGMAYALAANCHLVSINDQQVELSLSATHQPMLNTKLKDRIANALHRHYGKPLQLNISITTLDIITPAKQQHDAQTARLTQAKEKMLANPLVRQFIEMYDATLEVSLL